MGDCTLFYFVSWGIIGGLLCIFGFFGNSLSLLVFQRDKRAAATTLLQALAASDFVLLLSVFITDPVPYICNYVTGCVNPWSSWPYIRYIWILTPMAHMCSIWFVVLIALNRYYAVCQAIDMNRVWSNQRTPFYILIVLVVVIGFNSPRFFEYEISEKEVVHNYSGVLTNHSHQHIMMNLTISENSTEYEYGQELTTIYSVHKVQLSESLTELGSHSTYRVVYKVLLVNILLILVPIILLIAFTIKILVVLHETKKRLRKMKSHNKNGTCKPLEGRKSKRSKSKARASQEITLILILVVIVAIICQAPLCVFHFVRYTVPYECGHLVFYLDNISKLLVNVNSSANFIIYCLFGPKFRRILRSMLMCGHSNAMQIEPYASISRREYSMRELRNRTVINSVKETPPLVLKSAVLETHLNGDVTPQYETHV